MEKQEKYCKKELTEKLITLGFTPEDKNGFQTHELINLLPEKIEFKNTYHDEKERVFIKRDKKTKFKPEITMFTYKFGYYNFGYSLKKLDKNEFDQAHIVDNIVDMFAEMLIYITRQLSYQ